jgi:pimeloyl-ACP methyl ester carboxylesterase
MPTTRANGIDLYSEERGKGEPLVLISGIGMQLVEWPEPLLNKLAERGPHRVIVFDNRDVGESTKLRDMGVPPIRSMLMRRLFRQSVSNAPYTLFDMAADVVGLLDALDIPHAHIAGVSLGGMVAQAMAIDHGRRQRTLTSIMSHSGGAFFTGRLSSTSRFLRKPPRSREEAILQKLDFFRSAGSTSFARDEVALMERSARAYDRSHHPAGFARQFGAVLATGDMRPRLRSVSVPTLVLHGTSDGIFKPFCGRATADAIPNSEFRLIEGWGHDLADGVTDILVDEITSHTKKHSS